MTRFDLQAPVGAPPLVALPKGAGLDPDTGLPYPPVVVIDLDFGRRPAGCAVCHEAIPAETTRVVVRVRLVRPVENKNGSVRTHERHYIHPGCLTDRIRPEIIRARADCYDCGAIPSGEMSETGFVRWGSFCFTTSKFAPAPLCPTCAAKPKWARCNWCGVHYPHWMVSRAAEHPEDLDDPFGQFSAQAGPQPDGPEVCEHCAARRGIRTEAAVNDAKEQYERLRREIAERGVFDAGED